MGDRTHLSKASNRCDQFFGRIARYGQYLRSRVMQLRLEPRDLANEFCVAIATSRRQIEVTRSPRGLIQCAPAFADRRGERDEVMNIAQKPEIASAISAKERPPESFAICIPDRTVSLNGRMERVNVRATPGGVHRRGFSHLRVYRVSESYERECVRERQLPTDCQPQIAGNHAFWIHTAAHLNCGCLLTGSQSVSVSSLAAVSSTASAFP